MVKCSTFGSLRRLYLLTVFTVEEFYPKPDPPNWFQRHIIPKLRKTLPFLGPDDGDGDDDDGDEDSSDSDDHGSDNNDTGPYTLPKIPHGWAPDSVSEIEKRHDVAEKLMAQEGFPELEELYFSPAEVAARKYWREAKKIAEAKAAAIKEIENHCGIEYKYIKDDQRRQARIEMDIDPVTEMKRVRSTTQASSRQTTRGRRFGRGARTASLSSISPSQPARSTQPSPSGPIMSGARQDTNSFFNPRTRATSGQKSSNLNRPASLRNPGRTQASSDIDEEEAQRLLNEQLEDEQAERRKETNEETAQAMPGSGEANPPARAHDHPAGNTRARSPRKRAGPSGPSEDSSPKRRK
jgi:hypothetical protein